MMKTKLLFSMMVAGLWLAPSGALLHGREPARTIADLARLQDKVEAVAAKVSGATVALLSDRTGSSGSGVVTTANGLILTAAHVVQGSKELLVVFPNGRQVPGRVLGANYSKDIAMVQITGGGVWPFAERGVSKPLEAGSWVIALGHSEGFEPDRPPPVRFGRVISKGPGNFLSTDCTLIGGDSGGPLFDLDGKIVGINSNIGESVKNNNHAGIDGFRDDWDRMVKGEQWGSLQLNPLLNPERPMLGIQMGRARRGEGVPVEVVYPRTPAAAAGIKIDDLITAVDGSTIKDEEELLQVLAKKQPGEVVTLGVVRDDQPTKIKVTLDQYDKLFRIR
jgi:serine protease Do